MLKKLVKQLERRAPFDAVQAAHSDLFDREAHPGLVFSEKGFSELLAFIEGGETSYQAVAVQAGVKWASSSQRVKLRNALSRRGLVTPSCLWAYRQLRGHQDLLFQDHTAPEMGFMQIVLLKEADPLHAIPFLIERYLTRKDAVEELRAMAGLCVLRLLDSASSEQLVRSLQSRYPDVEIFFQWRPSIPQRDEGLNAARGLEKTDFHQMVRSVHDLKELSSLTRTVYLISQFYVPLSEKEWRSLLLSRTDQKLFTRFAAAGIIEEQDGGLILSTDEPKRNMVRKFLYNSYTLAKESVNRTTTERVKEEHARRVKTSELDRQALEMAPEGIICVDRGSRLYYTNPAAERLLKDNTRLRERLFGDASLEDALRNYSRDKVLARISSWDTENGDSAEIFGHRIALACEGKHFEVELGPQVILIRDATDRRLVDEEIGRLYRHEFKAALDVMGAGLAGVRDLLGRGNAEEALDLLDQVERKRTDLFSMLEERIDFIRLHSDSFRIRPSPTNLNAVADRCVANYKEAAAAKGIEIHSNHLSAEGAMVSGEERFLVRAVDNILRNAIKFSEKGSTVYVTIELDGREAALRIRDEGPGIPPENLGRVFQLGFTTGGAGRGLYLARRIVAAHGGRIDAQSKPGEGACFTVRLPALMEA